MRRPLTLLVSVLLALALLAGACGSDDGTDESADAPSTSALAPTGGKAAGKGPAKANGPKGTFPPKASTTTTTRPKATTTTKPKAAKPAAKPKPKPAAPAPAPKPTTTAAPKPAPTTTAPVPKTTTTLPRPDAFCAQLGVFLSSGGLSLTQWDVANADQLVAELEELRALAPAFAAQWVDWVLLPAQMLREQIAVGQVYDKATADAWALSVAGSQPEVLTNLQKAFFNLMSFNNKRCLA